MEAPLSRRDAISLLAAALFLGACSTTPQPYPQEPTPPRGPAQPGLRTQRPYQINGIWYYPLPTAQGYTEEGMASWYGPDFHGKPTSCGERYDMHGMTAAHKTLPLGTHVKVTNLQNGRSIILRVNDRGPFVSGRIIDLSYRGAQELDSARKGLCHVRVEAVQLATAQQVGQDTMWKVDPVPSFRYGLFTIQIGAFRESSNAYRLKERIAQGGREVSVVQAPDRNGTIMHRVQVGRRQDIQIAQKDLAELRRTGFGDSFIVAVEGQQN